MCALSTDCKVNFCVWGISFCDTFVFVRFWNIFKGPPFPQELQVLQCQTFFLEGEGGGVGSGGGGGVGSGGGGWGQGR